MENGVLDHLSGLTESICCRIGLSLWDWVALVVCLFLGVVG